MCILISIHSVGSEVIARVKSIAATAELLYGKDLIEPIIQHLAAELVNVILQNLKNSR